MSTFHTQGLVLRSYNFLEADKIFSIYTNTHGKIEARACGVRKIKSKLRAHLEPFSVVNLMIAHGRRQDRLASATIKKNYKKIKSNYKLLIINYQLLELIDQLTKHHHPDPRIFNLLVQVFDFLEVSEKQESNKLQQVTTSYNKLREGEPQRAEQVAINYKILHSYFVLNFLSLLGYTPEVNFCIRCKSKIQVNHGFKTMVYFSFRDGSVICPKCAVTSDTPISSESLGILKKYLTENLAEVRHGFKTMPNLGTQESHKLIQQFLNHHLDRPLKSVFL